MPALLNTLAVDESLGCALCSSDAEPLLGPWQALDTTMQPLQPFASISTLEAALAYTAALSKVGSSAGSQQVMGQAPREVSGALSASSTHVRMRLHAILDNL